VSAEPEQNDERMVRVAIGPQPGTTPAVVRQIAEAHAALDRILAALADRDAALGEAQEAYRFKRTEAERLSRDLDEVVEQRETLLTALGEARAELAQVSEYLDVLTNERLLPAEAELGEARKERDDYQAAMQAWQTISDERKAELGEARKRIEGLEQDWRATNEERLYLKRRIEGLEAQVQEAIPVLEYVSRGRRYVDVTAYPDARARRVIGLIHDAYADTPTTAPSEGERDG